MVASPPSPDDIRDALETPVDFNFELPDPEDEGIEEFEEGLRESEGI